MKNNKKDDYVKYQEVTQVRLTNQQKKILASKAIEQNTTVSELIRQSVMNYINRNMSDTEIVHSSLVENSRKIRYLENKIELLALIVLEQTKYFMKIMPQKQINTDSLVEIEFQKFNDNCMKILKTNHGGILESMILDLYEQDSGDNYD